MHTFLYILVWRPGEPYADIMQLSMSFLREVHPEAQILLLTDPETSNTLQNAEHPLLSLTNRLIVAEVSHNEPSVRSWYLKSRMRRLVQGDFVFLDADTIIRQPLNELFQIDAPIAMAENHSMRFPENFHGIEQIVYERNGWPMPGNGHFLNSGVIYWKDTPEAHRLSMCWEELWDVSISNGYGYDQPALNAAIEKSDVRFHVLDDRYNAQIRANSASGVDAAVWHFYQTDRRWFPDDWFSLGKKHIRSLHGIDDDFLGEVIESRTPYPIGESGSVSDLIEHLKSGKPLNTAVYERLTGIPLPSTENATVCTIITANYLTYARSLLHSIRTVEPEVHFNIFISDKDRESFSGSISDSNTFFYFPEDVCRQGVGLHIRNKYQHQNHDNFRWSCKPVFINYLIQERSYERVIYFDCDVFIFNRIRFLFDSLKTHHVLLTPHWRSHDPDIDQDEYRTLFREGIYNAGFAAASLHGTDAMDWWARCCLHSCARGSFEGEYDDQAILNLMPVYFEGVHVLRHKGCNVAVWNKNECQRVVQADGSVKIEDKFPIVFIHFNSGIPRSWDPLLGTYMDQYLSTLKTFSEEVWQREINKRNPARDTYIEQKSSQYLRIKKRVVKARLSCLSFSKVQKVAILAQSGTSQQCLGLWLRQNPGTLLSSVPVTDWYGDGMVTLDEKLFRYQQLSSSKHDINHLLSDAMQGKISDPIHVNWADWTSLISPRRMIMNFPEGILCWPELADILGHRHPVIALVCHPLPFSRRMMAIHGDGFNLHCMSETRRYLKEHPERPNSLESMLPAQYAWVIKWCLDMKALETLSACGRQIILVKEEDLMIDTENTLVHVFRALGWQWPGDISAHFQVYCRFQNKTLETDTTGRIQSIDEEKMALIQLMRSFNIKSYAFDQHALMKVNPHGKSNKAH